MSLSKYVKSRETWLARLLYDVYKAVIRLDIPAPKWFWHPVYLMHKGIVSLVSTALQRFYYLPMFRSRCENNPKRMNLYSGMPLILGNVSIRLGDDCRVSGVSTISGRTSSKETPQLIVGNNSSISWQNQISVGSKIVMGDNVRLAPRVMLAGYPGHPIDRKARAAGLADTDDQVGDIIIGDDAWLATGVVVLAGVTIGAGTIVGTNSVVTKDLPPMCFAAGSPAKVIRYFEES